jgi:hypothetical protein
MRTTRRFALFALFAAAVTAVTVLTVPSTAAAAPPAGHRTHLLASGLQGTVGSTVGPDGALYVAESVAGRISRVDPRTGHITTFATGLPKRMVDIGGAMDIAFVHRTAYVLVTLVSPDVGGTDIDGIYRMDGPDHFTVVADIGAWSVAHPPIPDFFIPTGVQFALQWYRGAFLVTDGHHNRVLRVTLDGTVSERIAFPDIVPTGLAVRGRTVYLAEAGPVPHLPQNGKVVAFRPGSGRVTEVASGAPLLVDVEFGRGGGLYALSQGHFTPGNPEGSPADPGTGALERIHRDGRMTPVVSGLDRPASLEFIGDTGYVLTLTGEIWRIDHVSRQPAEHH